MSRGSASPGAGRAGSDSARRPTAPVRRARPLTVSGLPASSGRRTKPGTVLVGEKALDRRSFNTGSWFWDEPVFSGGSGGTDRWGTAVIADGAGTAFPTNWGSSHDAAALFLFGDGSVRPLRYGLNGDVMLALLTPAGGEPVNPEP